MPVSASARVGTDEPAHEGVSRAASPSRRHSTPTALRRSALSSLTSRIIISTFSSTHPLPLRCNLKRKLKSRNPRVPSEPPRPRRRVVTGALAVLRRRAVGTDTVASSLPPRPLRGLASQRSPSQLSKSLCSPLLSVAILPRLGRAPSAPARLLLSRTQTNTFVGSVC